jgi:hypothetical protein
MLCHRKKILFVYQMGINEFQMLCSGFNKVEIMILCPVVNCSLNEMGLNMIDV